MPVPMLAAAVESSNVTLPDNSNNNDGAAAAAAAPDSDAAIASLGQGMASVAIHNGGNNDDDMDDDDDDDDDDDEEGADKEFTDALRDGRVKGGCCVNCGTKLFRTKRTGLLGRKKRYKPLTVPGRVLRGQCLNCTGKRKPLHRVDIDSEMAAAVALSAMDEPANTDATPAADPGTTSAIQATYKGSFNNNGKRHGQGELEWSNGDLYKGSFVAGVREGHGTLFFNDGTHTRHSFM